jgi:hypothetical protein
MAADTWESRALPILEFLSGTDDKYSHCSIEEIAQATSVEPRGVVSELRRLLAGEYVIGEVREYLSDPPDVGSWRLVGTGLSEKGARAIGMWPPELLYSAFLELLEDRIVSADSESKSKLIVVRDALVQLGVGVGTSLLTAFIRSHS